MIKAKRVKEKLVEYFMNYSAYVVCVVVLSFFMGREIKVKEILAMAIVIVIVIELWNGTRSFYNYLYNRLRK
jgi:uncharacterized membrane protein